MVTIVKLFRLPLEKTFLYISQTKNTWHGLVLHQSLYRLTQGPWISKSIGGLAKHLWILPLNKHMDLSYAEHKKLANSYSKEPRFETAICYRWITNSQTNIGISFTKSQTQKETKTHANNFQKFLPKTVPEQLAATWGVLYVQNKRRQVR